MLEDFRVFLDWCWKIKATFNEESCIQRSEVLFTRRSENQTQPPTAYYLISLGIKSQMA